MVVLSCLGVYGWRWGKMALEGYKVNDVYESSSDGWAGASDGGCTNIAVFSEASQRVWFGIFGVGLSVGMFQRGGYSQKALRCFFSIIIYCLFPYFLRAPVFQGASKASLVSA